MDAGDDDIWAAVAANWAARADEIDERTSTVTAAMLDAVELTPGARVLELACGPGGVGLAAAERVGPDGHVVLSDSAHEMTTIAADRAAARGLGNVSTAEVDLADIALAADSFDAVVCRYGLMFAPDPAASVAGIARVLRPGGRAAVAVWGPEAANPWLSIGLDAIGAQIGMRIPPEGVPGPFTLGGDGAVGEALRRGGLEDVNVREVPTPQRSPSFDDWWDLTVGLAAPVMKIVAGLPEEGRAALRERVRTTAEPYLRPDGSNELPGVSLVASGRRAAA